MGKLVKYWRDYSVMALSGGRRFLSDKPGICNGRMKDIKYGSISKGDKSILSC